jgi:hypothetical protein
MNYPILYNPLSGAVPCKLLGASFQIKVYTVRRNFLIVTLPRNFKGHGWKHCGIRFKGGREENKLAEGSIGKKAGGKGGE